LTSVRNYDPCGIWTQDLDFELESGPDLLVKLGFEPKTLTLS
jgi:hypothetical protein